jgi:hypothetical protein
VFLGSEAEDPVQSGGDVRGWGELGAEEVQGVAAETGPSVYS